MIPDPDPAGQVLCLPSWIPGSYLVRDFAKHVIEVHAHGDSGEAAVHRVDKRTIRCDAVSGPLLVEYTVHAFDSSVRKAYLDERRGFFNGSSLLYLPQGKEDQPCQLELRRPPDSAFADWRAATGLTPDQVDAAGFGVYRAANYAELIDHPVEIGAFEQLPFDVDGIPHAVVLSGRYRVDADRLKTDLTAICAAQRELFGGEPPLDRYLFLTNVVGSGYGGLEHRNSCALICSREDLPRDDGPRDKRYRGFLGLCSHEYFHLWNVKRIRPQAFAESDLAAEAYTRDLWHYEGVTSYYDNLFLRRAGLIDDQEYLDLLAADATRVQRTPGRAVQSLADASFEAWTKFYQPDSNTPNATVSYYVKGALAALCVDLHLRLHAGQSLDAAMRLLWERNGRDGTPVPEGGLEAIIVELAGENAPPLDEWLRGTGELPLAELLAEFGIEATRRAATSATDEGGATQAPALRGYTGLVLRGAHVALVRSGTTGQLAGLSGGDELVAIDGVRCGANAQKLLDALRAGQCVEVHYFRDDELHRCSLHVTDAPQDTWVLRPAEADEAQRARRAAWLGRAE